MRELGTSTLHYVLRSGWHPRVALNKGEKEVHHFSLDDNHAMGPARYQAREGAATQQVDSPPTAVLPDSKPPRASPRCRARRVLVRRTHLRREGTSPARRPWTDYAPTNLLGTVGRRGRAAGHLPRPGGRGAAVSPAHLDCGRRLFTTVGVGRSGARSRPLTSTTRAPPSAPLRGFRSASREEPRFTAAGVRRRAFALLPFAKVVLLLREPAAHLASSSSSSVDCVKPCTPTSLSTGAPRLLF